jgi:PiT family inorganic phosphate transporter
MRHDLPTIPLVPVSSSQAIVGAVIGIGLLKKGKSIRWRTLGGIASGWVVTPIIAGVISFFSLFFLQNVFEQQTYQPISYALTSSALFRIETADLSVDKLEPMEGKMFPNAIKFERALSELGLSNTERQFIMESSEIDKLKASREAISKMDADWFTSEQKESIKKLEDVVFAHKWQLAETLARLSPQWQFVENNKKQNQDLQNKLSYLYRLFRVKTEFKF